MLIKIKVHNTLNQDVNEKNVYNIISYDMNYYKHELYFIYKKENV